MRALPLAVPTLGLVAALAAPPARSQTPVGPEFRVNSHTTGTQARPAVAVGPGGDFVVVWESREQDGSAYGVFAQRFDAAGVPAGGEFRINLQTVFSQYTPKVAALAGGQFVVVWASRQDGSGYGVFGRILGSDGSLGEEFQVNAWTTGHQTRPAVARVGGGFVVVWHSGDGSAYGVVGRSLDGSGGPAGDEFRVNTYTTGYQLQPAVAGTSDTDFVVVWDSVGQDGSGLGVFAQRLGVGGTPIGPEFRVNTYVTSHQRYPAVAAHPAGFVVVWEGHVQDGDSYGVFGQRYDAAGVPAGPEFQVNAWTTGTQRSPSVSAGLDGRFVVAWQSTEIAGRRYDAAGTAAGGEFRINSYTTGAQSSPSVSETAGGRFVAVWESFGQDGSGLGVFGQRFADDLIFGDGFGR
jgi:hypothetical protein